MTPLYVSFWAFLILANMYIIGNDKFFALYYGIGAIIQLIIILIKSK